MITSRTLSPCNRPSSWWTCYRVIEWAFWLTVILRLQNLSILSQLSRGTATGLLPPLDDPTRSGTLNRWLYCDLSTLCALMYSQPWTQSDRSLCWFGLYTFLFPEISTPASMCFNPQLKIIWNKSEQLLKRKSGHKYTDLLNAFIGFTSCYFAK